MDSISGTTSTRLPVVLNDAQLIQTYSSNLSTHYFKQAKIIIPCCVVTYMFTFISNFKFMQLVIHHSLQLQDTITVRMTNEGYKTQKDIPQTFAF